VKYENEHCAALFKGYVREQLPALNHANVFDYKIH